MADFAYKLAAIDIDDTLVGPDKRVSPANAAAVRRLREAGCRIVLASGRRYENMLGFYRQLGLDDEYLVASGGAVAHHPRTGERLYHAPVPMPEAAEVVAEGLERGLTVMYWAADGVFARQRSPWIDQYSADCLDPVTIVDVESLANRGDTPAEKIVWGAKPTEIAALAPKLRQRYAGRLQLTVTDDWFLEFAAPSATKAYATAVVAARHGINRSEVLAFGDGNNDVQILAWAGLGVAMPHGRPAAREAANRVGPAGDPETALARAVTEIFATGADAGTEDPSNDVAAVGEAA